MDRDPDVQRDSQQIQDDNQTSGESVVAGQTSGDNQQPIGNADTPNQAANKEPAEGSRETVGAGISNRPADEERQNQERVPPRGTNKEGGHA
jgi:hypothetical protein